MYCVLNYNYMERNRQNNLWFKKKTRFCLERQANAFAVFCSSSPSGKSIFLCMFCLFTTYEKKSKIYWLNVLRIIHYSQHPHQVRIPIHIRNGPIMYVSVIILWKSFKQTEKPFLISFSFIQIVMNGFCLFCMLSYISFCVQQELQQQ